MKSGKLPSQQSHTLQHVQLYCELFKQKGGLPELHARTSRAHKSRQKQRQNQGDPILTK